jgi:hypothetical protein
MNDPFITACRGEQMYWALSPRLFRLTLAGGQVPQAVLPRSLIELVSRL